MLTKRIIPCLDVKDGRVVKGVNFLQLRDAGDPVEVARRYEEAGADELVFLDISASHEGRAILLDVVRRVAEEVFMPFTVGGGIRTLEDATRLIQAGAEKVSINSAAVRTPELITQVSRKFGRCATVVNIDPRRVLGCDGRETWEVHINGGRVPSGLEAVAWARRVAAQPRREPEVNKLFRAVMKHQGSDLHLKVGQPPMMRLKGIIQRMNAPPLTQEQMERLLLPMLNERQRRILDEEGGVDLSYVI